MPAANGVRSGAEAFWPMGDRQTRRGGRLGYGNAMLEAVLLNLLAAAIWEPGLSPLLAGASKLSRDDLEATGSSRFQAAVGLALHRLDKAFRDGLLDRDDLANFLGTPDVRSIVKSVYLFRLDASIRGLDSARADFLALWDRRAVAEHDVGMAVYDGLLAAIEDSLDVAVSDGVLSAHEAKSAARHKLTTDHLEALDRKLSLLTGESPIDPAAIDVFEGQLRAEVVNRNAHITPPDFYGAPRVEIDRLYVPANLSDPRRTDGNERQRRPIDRWLRGIHRAVVLGNPGGGKSTLAKKLCHAVGNRSPGWQIAGFAPSPMLIVLRDYGAAKTDRGTSIRDFVEDVARSSFNLTSPKGCLSTFS
jgi:hypothetical protein